MWKLEDSGWYLSGITTLGGYLSEIESTKINYFRLWANNIFGLPYVFTLFLGTCIMGHTSTLRDILPLEACMRFRSFTYFLLVFSIVYLPVSILIVINTVKRIKSIQTSFSLLLYLCKSDATIYEGYCGMVSYALPNEGFIRYLEVCEDLNSLNEEYFDLLKQLQRSLKGDRLCTQF